VSTLRERRRLAQGEKAAQAFNSKVPIGSAVTFWPGVREGAGRLSVTRTEAWSTLSGHAIVCVEGYSGGIALTHIEITDQQIGDQS
jgi:hypothetical protein